MREQYGLDARLQGSWFRCCGGQIRKLMDCCANTPKRINGDAALHGYCYGAPQRLLRHLLRHRAAVLTVLALCTAGLIAGVSGAWSP